ncbi:AAA family ATPase [Mesorhizobium sp. NZP2077]|uniref:ATP-binding protein n=1 Tax=Mesorhizobium sp. NZP2077 TaxID=2483404 RepID=UPI0015566D36|nr:YhaN family protein [Mesorhizobium sp. NZP2077]QKD19515.1 AAA family ATPase [Mesorhizobium sp. NZP2077]
MRLRRLDLTRYGKFTDKAIDFGPKPSSGPDLHIVFGLNEAGKSTALSAYLDLLFGIEERSRYNFLHEYSSMRIGGLLEFEAQTLAVSRTKSRSNSLHDAEGRPLSEIAISAHLAGLSRDAYSSMFSLDDETLEIGGKAILESRGDLGKLLFTASAGLGHVSDVLAALETEADGLHRKQAQTTEIALLKKRFAELKSRKEQIDTLASTFETLEAERVEAQDKYDRSLSERSVLSARLATIDRYARAAPLLAEIKRKASRLAELPDIPSPPRTWSGSVAELIDQDARLRTRIQANADEIDRANAKIEAIAVDEALLAISEQVRRLADRKARYASAGMDLPTRKMEVQMLDQTVANCLAELGKSAEQDPSRLILPAFVVGTLRNMVEQRSGITATLRMARDEAAAVLDGLNAARGRVGEERAVPEPVRARLIAAVSQAKASSHTREITEARGLEDERQTRLAGAMRRLQPWSGDAEALSKISVPLLTQMAAWKTLAASLQKDKAVLSERLTEHEQNRVSTSSRLAAVRAAADLADDDTAAAIRRERDEAWRNHRADLRAETADVFAAVLARDDHVVMARLSRAGELADLRAIEQKAAETEAAVERISCQLAGVEKRAEMASAEVKETANALLEDCREQTLDLLIGLLDERIAARADALAAWDDIVLARVKIERATAEGERIHLGLALALQSVGIASEAGETLEVMAVAADRFLDRQAKVDAEQAEALRSVAAKEEELAARRLAVEIAERREEAWQAEVRETLKGTWLEEGIAGTGLGSVLDQLSELSKALQDREAMRIRIRKMEADRTAFAEEVSRVGAQAGEPAGDVAPEQGSVRLTERLEQAERAREARANLLLDVQKLQDVREALNADFSAHETTKQEVLDAFGAKTLPEVVERDEQLRERDGLQSAVGELEERLTSELTVDDLIQAQSLLEGLDLDGLAIEKAEVERRLADFDESLQEQLVRRTRATDKLDAIGGDSAVARIDADRRTVLLEIEEKAVRYIELKLGVMSAASALQVYRERHRSGMLREASDAFALMTRGQYTGLTTQPVKGGEVLIATQRDGQSKVADALSKGARFQLYLALRLAGYYEFAKLRPAVPFIADDIMETFDHLRSEEVFRLFGEMASVGQVIYLTHHQHLCDIAKAVIPDVMIHELG